MTQPIPFPRPRTYRPLTLALLAASAGCLLMITLRVAVTGSLRYGFLVWNLFLAWIPYGLALLILRTGPAAAAGRRPLTAALGLLWLFFYPNAPYILTDFIHVIRLRPGVGSAPELVSVNALLWYDIILNSAFAFVGHSIGLISLLLLHLRLRERHRERSAWGFVAVATILGGYGIYLGRFERYNSWQVFSAPLPTLRAALVNLVNPKAVLFGLAFAFFIFLTYLITWALHESARRS